MVEDRGTLRAIAWGELFPWVMLFRVVRIALQARLVIAGTLGMLAMLLGWWLLAWVFSRTGDESLAAQLSYYEGSPWAEAPAVPAESGAARVDRPMGDWFWPADAGPAGSAVNPIVEPWRWLTAPFRALFGPRLSIDGLAFFLLAAFWANAVWALFGGTITRVVALALTREEAGSIFGAARYARRKWRSYFGAPVFPLIGVLLILIPMALVGLLLRGGEVGVILAGIVWPLLMLAALAMTIFLVGLAFGWPLMWPTISTEGTDSFDALSRAYSYVYQRPLRYFLLAALAAVLGALGLFVVAMFGAGVIYLTAWAASWGGGSAILTGELAESAPRGMALLGFWSGVVRLVVIGFAMSYFFTAATAIYLLLRMSVDGTETDEVFLEEQEESFALPPLGSSPATPGVPTVVDDADESDGEESGLTESARQSDA